MNKFKIYLFISFWLSFSQLAEAYVLSQTKSGIPVQWSSTSTTVDLYVNSQNTQALDETTVQTIAASSVAQWNGVGNINLRKNSTTGQGQAELNELYFSTDPSVFNGSGVIGLTQIGFKETNGEIVEADILINDNYSFSTTTSDASYLGNVLTHEVGHFLGLGHGQVSGSTMFYSLSRGQYKINTDDQAGLYALYPTGSVSKGSLTGTIIGGKNLSPVFGAHVQAISVKTGKVAAAALSESNGRFRIDGLSQNDQYLIYTSPVKQIGLPSYYANVKNDFCESSKSYRGSFYQSCGANSEGFPQALKLASGLLEVGKITIRCGLDVPPEYFQTKGSATTQFDLNSYSPDGLGGSFAGFFSDAEMASGTALDKFRLNLSGISDWNTVSTSTSLFVHLKIRNQLLYSPFKANVSVTRSGVTTAVAPKYNQESDGWMNIETDVYIPINRATSSDNDLIIQVSPEDMRTSLPAGIPYTRTDYFPSLDEFGDSLYFYLAIVDIVKSNGDGTYTQVSSRSDILSDNTNCPDAINTYALTDYTTKGKPSDSAERKKVAACGTVDMDNGASGGPGGFMVGLILSFIISYALSRYSKMA